MPGISTPERRRRALVSELWHAGRLRYLIREKRPHAQLSLYDWIHGWKAANPDDPGPLCLTTRRRLGKSHLLGILHVERCLRLPNQVCKLGAPWFKQVREVFRPILNRILRDCPDSLRPETSGYVYTFRNPRWRDPHAVSQIIMVGSNTDSGDRLRGTDLDFGSLDEVRDIKDLKYIQDDILMPQFLDRPLPLLIYTTTMPRSLAHDYITEVLPAARREGRSKLFRVADLARDPMTPPAPEEDLDWTERHERLVLKNISKESATWRREYLCEEVPDLESLIIPEFPQVEADVTFEGEDYCEAHKGRPDHFHVYMGADLAWEDFSGILWGFYDFDEDLLVIEAEIARKRTTPREIAELIRQSEQTWYPEHYSQHSILRFADAVQLTLAGLVFDEGIAIVPTEKHDRDEAIAKLRTRFADRKIRIHRRCKELIYQLRNGIWDERRKDFLRSATLGHCDLLAALIYLNRMGPFRANPHPLRPAPPSSKFHPPWAPAPGPSGGTVTHEKTISRQLPRGGVNPFR